jgi:hypothetical protein
MQKHTVKLKDIEFRLFQAIQKIDMNNEGKDTLIEELIQHIENFTKLQSSSRKIKWLQVGDKSSYRPIKPVKPEKGSPLASDIIVEQRKQIIGNYE